MSETESSTNHWMHLPLAEMERLDLDHRNSLQGAPPLEAITNELELTQYLVASDQPQLRAFPLLIGWEWHVYPNRSQCGVGDLLFTDGTGRFAVVEVKFLTPRGGHTARESRRRGRRKVELQAKTFGMLLLRFNPGIRGVDSFYFTNFWSPPRLTLVSSVGPDGTPVHVVEGETNPPFSET